MYKEKSYIPKTFPLSPRLQTIGASSLMTLHKQDPNFFFGKRSNLNFEGVRESTTTPGQTPSLDLLSLFRVVSKHDSIHRRSKGPVNYVDYKKLNMLGITKKLTTSMVGGNEFPGMLTFLGHQEA